MKANNNLTMHLMGRRLRRRGNMIVLAAVLLVVVVAMVAFAVDIGFVALTRTDIQRATDSAALAGAGELVNGTTRAEAEAIEFLTMNEVGTRKLVAEDATVEFGRWTPAARSFAPSNDRPNAVRVFATLEQPTFFGRLLGRQTFSPSAESIAVFQPREISLVLDYSGSMCYDSQFRNISKIGKPAVEANLQQIFQELGQPKFGKLKFAPVKYGTTSTSNSTVKANFELTYVPYPFPDGSWDEYIDYVQSNSNIQAAGYRCSYGYLTWLDYVLANHSSYADTPVLWQVSEQPVTALKDAVDVFLDYLTIHSSDDRVAFSLYSSANSTGILEQSLTNNFEAVAAKCRQRQAGHYVGGTNISAGMKVGREELEKNSRPTAFRMMLLMTDGVVNLPTGNTNKDKQAVIAEANKCAEARIPIVTIALGSEADVQLMKQVADITDGAAFVVPGGQPIADVREQLEEVFAQVAADRPLQLVK